MSCKKILGVHEKTRPQGRPNNTIIHSFLNDISKIIPNDDKYGSFHTWAHVAHDLIRWSFLVNNLHKYEPKPCVPDTNLDWDNLNSPGSKNSPLLQLPLPPPSPISLCYSFSFNIFKILGIYLTSTKSEVTKTFRSLARLHRPDKWDASKEFTSEEVSESLSIFQMLTKAFCLQILDKFEICFWF